MKKLFLPTLFTAIVASALCAQSAQDAETPPLPGPTVVEPEEQRAFPVPQIPKEKLNELVSSALKTAPEQENPAQHFSIVTDAEKIAAFGTDASDPRKNAPGTAAAIIVSVPAEETDAAHNPYFAAGMAVRQMTGTAHRIGLHASVNTEALETVNARRDDFGVPAGYDAAAVVLVAELPPFHGFPQISDGRHPAPRNPSDRCRQHGFRRHPDQGEPPCAAPFERRGNLAPGMYDRPPHHDGRDFNHGAPGASEDVFGRTPPGRAIPEVSISEHITVVE